MFGGNFFCLFKRYLVLFGWIICMIIIGFVKKIKDVWMIEKNNLDLLCKVIV